MTTFRIGDTTITRIEEVLGPGFVARQILPDWSDEAVAPHLSWLVPDHYEPEKRRLVASLHSWMVRTPRHTILVDTCAGNHKNRPGSPGFHMLDRPYLANLAAAGVRPEEIDFVLCTHLHVDHVGWNTRLDNGRWVPTFPNARYVFSKTERDHFDPSRGQSGMAGNAPLIWADSILPVIDSGKAHVVDGTDLIGGDLMIEPAPGHTPGHVTLALERPQGRALFTGDITHHPIQLHYPDWSSAFCFDKAQSAATRRRVLERCADTGALYCPAHFGRPHAGRIARTGNAFRLAPAT